MQTPFYGQNPIDYGLTVGTSSSAVLAANPYRTKLVFHNPNATAKIAVCCAVDQNNVAQPAVMNGKGSFIILPLSTLTLDVRPVSAWNAISDTVSSALTILESI